MLLFGRRAKPWARCHGAKRDCGYLNPVTDTSTPTRTTENNTPILPAQPIDTIVDLYFNVDSAIFICVVTARKGKQHTLCVAARSWVLTTHPALGSTNEPQFRS